MNKTIEQFATVNLTNGASGYDRAQNTYKYAFSSSKTLVFVTLFSCYILSGCMPEKMKQEYYQQESDKMVSYVSSQYGESMAHLYKLTQSGKCNEALRYADKDMSYTSHSKEYNSTMQGHVANCYGNDEIPLSVLALGGMGEIFEAYYARKDNEIAKYGADLVEINRLSLSNNCQEAEEKLSLLGSGYSTDYNAPDALKQYQKVKIGTGLVAICYQYQGKMDDSLRLTYINHGDVRDREKPSSVQPILANSNISPSISETTSYSTQSLSAKQSTQKKLAAVKTSEEEPNYAAFGVVAGLAGAAMLSVTTGAGEDIMGDLISSDLALPMAAGAAYAGIALAMDDALGEEQTTRILESTVNGIGTGAAEIAATNADIASQNNRQSQERQSASPANIQTQNDAKSTPNQSAVTSSSAHIYVTMFVCRMSVYPDRRKLSVDLFLTNQKVTTLKQTISETGRITREESIENHHMWRATEADRLEQKIINQKLWRTNNCVDINGRTECRVEPGCWYLEVDGQEHLGETVTELSKKLNGKKDKLVSDERNSDSGISQVILLNEY